jgi:predicted phosphodiesterase
MSDILLKFLDKVVESFPDRREELRFLFFTDPHVNHINPMSRQDNYPVTILNKISKMAKVADATGCDFVLIGGDIYHQKPQTDLYKTTVIHTFAEFKVPVYTVFGNHDVYHANPETVNKSPLGVLLSSEHLRRLGALTFNVGGKTVLLQGQDYVLNPTLPEPALEADYKMLCGHAFVINSLTSITKEESFLQDDVKASKWDCLLMGHDHVPYPVVDLDGKLIVRPGALSRGTKHTINRVRDVFFDIVSVKVVGEGLKAEVRQEALPVAPAEQIFSLVRIEREAVSQKMSEFIAVMKDKSKQDISSEIGESLLRLCKDNPALFTFIKQYFTNFGISV